MGRIHVAANEERKNNADRPDRDAWANQQPQNQAYLSTGTLYTLLRRCIPTRSTRLNRNRQRWSPDDSIWGETQKNAAKPSWKLDRRKKKRTSPDRPKRKNLTFPNKGGKSN